MPTFPRPEADPRLVGTEDLGSFTAATTGSLGEKLQDIRDQLTAAGSVAQFAPYLGSNPIIGVTHPVFFDALRDAPTGASAVTTIQGQTVTGGSDKVVWDADFGRFVLTHITGTQSAIAWTPAGQVHPAGRAGAWPQDFAVAVPWGGYSIFVMEFDFKLAAQAVDDTARGIGFGAGNFASGDFVKFWRSTSGWSLTTRDNVTSSAATEASDTSDSNRHVARIEMETAQVRLYIDGTLKITKSTNLPRFETPGATFTTGRIIIPAADATGSMRWGSVAFYHKEAA